MRAPDQSGSCDARALPVEPAHELCHSSADQLTYELRDGSARWRRPDACKRRRARSASSSQPISWGVRRRPALRSRPRPRPRTSCATSAPPGRGGHEPLAHIVAPTLIDDGVPWRPARPWRGRTSGIGLPLSLTRPTRRPSVPVVSPASICAHVQRERCHVALMLCRSIARLPAGPRRERIGVKPSRASPVTHPARNESPPSAGSRRPGRVSSQASTSDLDSTTPSAGRGSRCAAAKARASCGAGRQCITSASIRRAKTRAAGAGWPRDGCPSCC
jgi:hypothetical protein